MKVTATSKNVRLVGDGYLLEPAVGDTIYLAAVTMGGLGKNYTEGQFVPYLGAGPRENGLIDADRLTSTTATGRGIITEVTKFVRESSLPGRHCGMEMDRFWQVKAVRNDDAPATFERLPDVGCTRMLVAA